MERFETTEKNEEKEGLSNFNKSELIFATALFIASLNPQNVKAAEIYQEQAPIIEPFRSYGPYRSDEEKEFSQFSSYSPVCYNLEAGDDTSVESMEEEREFDSSVLNISNWETHKMTLENVELMENGYVVKTVADKTDLYSIPLLQSSFIHKKYNDNRPVKKISVPHAMSYEIIEKRTLLGENGEEVTLGLIANDYKSQQGFVIVMSARDKFGTEEVFVEKEDNVEKEALDISISSTYSLVSNESIEQYPVNGDLSQQIDLLYGLEDLSYIEDLIKDDETVQSFIQLRDEFQNYNPKTLDLPKYLKTTDWYKDRVEKNGVEIVEEALKIPYIVRIPDQPLQCVGFVEMMEELYPELNMVDISSMSTEKGAQSLVPSSLFSNLYRENPIKVNLYGGGIGIGGYPIGIKEYQRGDIFVIPGGDFGHVGLVLGKYEVNGQDVLLLADSNKLVDGMVRLYIANENNIDELLGEQRFILRNE